MIRGVGLLTLLLMHFTLAYAESDSLTQEIELLRTSDERMMQKMDQMQQLVIELKNSLQVTKIQVDENAQLLKQLSDSRKEDQQCSSVLEQLVNDQLLQSAEVIKDIAQNSTLMFKDVHETKTLVQECLSKQITNECISSRSDHLAENTTVTSSRETISSTKPTEATTKVTTSCFKPHPNVVKANLIFGKRFVYYYADNLMSWLNANGFCYSVGMNPAILKTETEVNEVRNKIPIYQGYWVWVSARNTVPKTDSFYWSDDTPMTNDLWMTEFPSAFRTLNNACVWLEADKGKFGDWNCNLSSRPFCQAPHNGAATVCP